MANPERLQPTHRVSQPCTVYRARLAPIDGLQFEDRLLESADPVTDFRNELLIEATLVFGCFESRHGHQRNMVIRLEILIVVLR